MIERSGGRPDAGEVAGILLGSVESPVNRSIPTMEETMARNMNKRIHVSMNLSRVDDPWRYDTIAGIVQLAPTSPLFAIPGIQASVTALETLGASLKAANDTVAASRTKLASGVEIEANMRRAVDGELLTLKAAVENKATQTSDLASVGFEERGAPRTMAQVTPPESIDIKLPSKLRGQFTASAHEIGKTRWRYAAESSPDPIGENTWTTLAGYGKARKVTGPSGTKAWVRFARVRGQVQSEWSTPVLVTIP
jgi:hypothetical protein